MRKSYEQEMERCRVLIRGVIQNESIKKRISAIYSEERLATGDELYLAAEAAAQNQRLEKLEGSEAIRVFNESKDRIHEGLVKVRQAGRYFFKKEESVQKLLLLDTEIPSNFAQWKQQADATFNAVLNNTAIQDKVALIGLTSEVVATYKKEVDQIEQLRLNAEKEDGEAQQASQKKQDTYDALWAYCVDLRECLDLFYHGAERQKLEEVGIVVK